MEKTRKLLLRDNVNKLYPLLDVFEVTPEQKTAIRFMIDMMDYECFGIEENPYTLEHERIKEIFPHHAVMIIDEHNMVNMFGEEAVMLSKWMDLSLISHKNIDGVDIKRVTFPERLIETYKEVTIKRGIKVIVSHLSNNNS